MKMKNNLFIKQVKRNNLYSEYVGVLNGVLGLTNRQAQVLSILLDLTLTTPVIDGKKNILTKEYRRLIIDKIGIGYCNLSTVLRKFKDDGILINNDGWSIAEQYIPIIDNNNCYISLHLSLE